MAWARRTPRKVLPVPGGGEGSLAGGERGDEQGGVEILV